MSTTYTTRVIYGFWVSESINANFDATRLGANANDYRYLDEWVYAELDGVSGFSAGDECYFVGVSVFEVEDVTRARHAFTDLPQSLPEPEFKLKTRIQSAHAKLIAAWPALVGPPPQFYLTAQAG